MAPARGRLIRLAVVLAAALALGVLLRHAYASLLLPAWTFEVRLLLAGTPLVGSALRRAGADEVVQVRALALRAVVHEGKVRVLPMTKEASTLASRGILHPILVLAVLALLARDARHFGRLALAALPFLALVEALDVPLVLAEQLRIPDVYATGTLWHETPWTRFLDGGGRYALCLAAAGGAYAAHERISSLRPACAPSSPSLQRS